MNRINCCRNCVAPKRYPGCHSVCPEYHEEKEKYQEQKAKADLAKKISYGIEAQKIERVRKALRKRR